MLESVKFTLLQNFKQRKGSVITLREYLQLLEIKNEYKSKNEAPAIIVSGVWQDREKLIDLNKIIHCDIDHIKNADELKEVIGNDQKVLLVHKSFSGEGLKVFSYCPQVEESNYTAVVLEFIKYIESKYNVECDKKCKDIKRLCFIAYDDKYIFNSDAKFKIEPEKLVYSHEKDDAIQNIVSIKKEVTIQNIAAIGGKYESILKRLKDTVKPQFVVGSRNAHINKICWKAKRIGINKSDLEAFIFSNYSFSDDFKRSEAQAVINSIYNNINIEFGVEKVFYDDDVIDELLSNAKKKKDLRRELLDELCRGYYIVFFNSNEANRKDDVYDICKIIENKVYVLSQETFIMEVADKYNMLNEEIKKKISWQELSRDITDKYILSLPKVNIDISDRSLYFANNVKINRGVASAVNSSDLRLASKIFDFSFVLDDGKSKFETFVERAFGVHCKEYVMMLIGYLLEREPTGVGRDRVLMIMDNNAIDDEINYSNGGTGKSLFVKVLGEVVGLTSINGKTFDIQQNFAFSNHKIDNGLIVIDDVKRNFNFELLFNLITDGIEVERKFEHRYRIPAEFGVKLVITSNYKIPIRGESNERRRLDLFATDYYNINRSVEDDLGRMGLKFWDESEKNKFFTFLAKCWKYYIDKGFKYLVELNRRLNIGNINNLKRIETISDVVDTYYNEIIKRIESGTLYTEDLYDMYKKYCNMEGIKHSLIRKKAVELIKKDIENRIGIVLKSKLVRGTNGAVVRKYVVNDKEEENNDNDINIVDEELDF